MKPKIAQANLGGPNIIGFGQETYYWHGREVPGSRGDKYFDRTRELPGAKQLSDELKPSKKAAEGKD